MGTLVPCSRQALKVGEARIVEQERLPYKWVVLSIATLGVLMGAIDSTVVILALPDIMIDLHSNLVRTIWTLMAYIFVSTVLLLAFGRVADIFGRVRLYNLGFAIFTAGSLFCGLSQTDWELIIARVVQGAGGALMMVNSWAMITEAFPPEERGTALGINSMTFGIGATIGPVLGGFILSVASWRWVFFINIPIGTAATYFGYKYLRETSSPRPGERLDWIGCLLFSGSLLALLYGLTQGIEMGWGSYQIIGLFCAAALGLALFVLWEKRVEWPALDLKVFQNRLFDFSVAAATFQSLAIYSVQFIVVFYLQAVRGYSPLTAALLLLPSPVAQAITGPIGGRVSDRVGARIPATVGLLVQSVGVYWLGTTQAQTPYPHIALGLAMVGFGGGLFYSPNTSAALGVSDPGRLGVASATLATLRNTGMVTSFAVALAVAASAMPRSEMLKLFIGTTHHLGRPLAQAFVHGMSAALTVSAGLCIVAAGASLVRGPQQGRP